jgi:hypothetical protein
MSTKIFSVGGISRGVSALHTVFYDTRRLLLHSMVGVLYDVNVSLGV